MTDLLESLGIKPASFSEPELTFAYKKFDSGCELYVACKNYEHASEVKERLK